MELRNKGDYMESGPGRCRFVRFSLFGGAKFGWSDAVVLPETFGEISGR